MGMSDFDILMLIEYLNWEWLLNYVIPLALVLVDVAYGISWWMQADCSHFYMKITCWGDVCLMNQLIYLSMRRWLVWKFTWKSHQSGSSHCLSEAADTYVKQLHNMVNIGFCCSFPIPPQVVLQDIIGIGLHICYIIHHLTVRGAIKWALK